MNRRGRNGAKRLGVRALLRRFCVHRPSQSARALGALQDASRGSNGPPSTKRISRLGTVNRSGTPNVQRSTFNVQRPTLNVQRWTVDVGRSIGCVVLLLLTLAASSLQAQQWLDKVDDALVLQTPKGL